MMFIGHCHVFPEGKFDQENPQRGTVEELAERLKSLGAEGGVAFAPFTQPEAYPFVTIDPNKWLYEKLKGGKYGNISAFMLVNPQEGERAVLTLKEYVRKGFVGVKIHPAIFKIRINDPSFEKFYATAEELRVPIVFHTGIDPRWRLSDCLPLLLDDIARKHPRLPLILAHTGGSAFFHQALAVIQNNENCYAEITSCVREGHELYIPEENLALLIRLIGSRRVIYGADYPYGELDSIKKDIAIINNWDISSQDKDNILGETLKGLIRGVPTNTLRKELR